jgi:hypothetical protein
MVTNVLEKSAVSLFRVKEELFYPRTEPEGSSKSLVTICQTPWYHISGDSAPFSAEAGYRHIMATNVTIVTYCIGK